jgi:hypothetical protein
MTTTKYGGETGGIWELLDEIHRDGIPWLLGNRELLESSMGFMTRSLGASAGGTRLYIHSL